MEELSPWPLPRHWYFYEPLMRRYLNTNVRCVACKPVAKFDPSKQDYAAVFHKFLVEYAVAEGHTVRAVMGVCMSHGKLYHRLGPELCKIMHWAQGNDGDMVQEHERMEWWFASTWGSRDVGPHVADARHLDGTPLEAHVDARKGSPERWDPPHSWIVKGLRTCYPWTDLARLDAMALHRASSRCACV